MSIGPHIFLTTVLGPVSMKIYTTSQRLFGPGTETWNVYPFTPDFIFRTQEGVGLIDQDVRTTLVIFPVF